MRGGLAAALGMHAVPLERDCIVAAEALGLTVPMYEEGPSRRVVFARKDGLALLLEPGWSTDPVAYVCPTVALATAGDVGVGGYGVLPYTHAPGWLHTLLATFARWDGDDALTTLLERADLR